MEKNKKDVEDRTRIAKNLYEQNNTTHYNKTTGKFEDVKSGEPVSPQKYLKDQKKLQKATDSLTMKDYYFDVSSNQFERRDNPPPHVSNSEREPKIHSAAYRHKFPDRYKKGYVKWYDRNKPERIVKTPLPKKIDVKNIKRKDEDRKLDHKFIDSTGFKPWLEPSEPRVPEPDLEVKYDPDLDKGIGSFFPAKK